MLGQAPDFDGFAQAVLPHAKTLLLLHRSRLRDLPQHGRQAPGLGIDPTPQKDGRRYFFDVTMDDAWSKRRRDSFALLVRHWPKVH